MNQVTTTHENLPSTYTHTAWGTEGVDTKDVLIPRLLLQQAMSKGVSSGTTSVGQVISSTSGLVVGSKEKPCKIVPISTYKTLIRREKAASETKFNFVSQVPVTVQNANFPWEGVENGVAVRNEYVLNFYVFLDTELDSEDGLPHLLSFSRTNYKAGKKLITHFKKSQMLGVPPASKTFFLVSGLETNDLGTYAVYDIQEAGATTKENICKLYDWYKVLKTSEVKVDVVEEETQEASQEEAPF